MLRAAVNPVSSRVRNVAWAVLIYGLYLSGGGVTAVELWYFGYPLERPRVWPLNLPPAILVGTGLVLVVTSIGLLRSRNWARSFLEAYAWLGIVLVPLTSIAPLIELARNWGLREALFAFVWTVGQLIGMCFVLHLLRSSPVRDRVREP
jgi:hypothetical protein